MATPDRIQFENPVDGKKWEVWLDARPLKQMKEELAKEGRVLYGYCDWEKRRIYVDPTQPDHELRDTIVHELIHATNRRMSEKRVSLTARVISTVLDFVIQRQARITPS